MPKPKCKKCKNTARQWSRPVCIFYNKLYRKMFGLRHKGVRFKHISEYKKPLKETEFGTTTSIGFYNA